MRRCITHGKSHTAEYRAWRHMNERCYKPNRKAFHNYGGRGISVCDRWRTSFEAFYADMGPRPSPHHSLERKDNNGNYEPSNCKWATRAEQQSNRRSTQKLTLNGVTLSIAGWSRRLGGNPHLVADRLKLNWPLDKALTVVALLPFGNRR